MSKKEIKFTKRPGVAAVPSDADAWVASPHGGDQVVKPEVAVAPQEPMKRLTIDIPESLHTRVKSQCAKRGAKMADEIRDLLETHFPVTG
jgi:hypothetical protein